MARYVAIPWWKQRCRFNSYASNQILKALCSNIHPLNIHFSTGHLLKLPFIHRCEVHNSSQRNTPSHRRAPSVAAVQPPPGNICANGLQNNPSRSRSVPEGLAHSHRGPADCHWNHCHWTTANGVNFCRPTRPIQVVEQITTSVWLKFKIMRFFLCISIHLLEGLFS